MPCDVQQVTTASRTYLVTQLKGCQLPHCELLMELLDALESRGGRRVAGSEAAILLGIQSRHALQRLLKRQGCARIRLQTTGCIRAAAGQNDCSKDPQQLCHGFYSIYAKGHTPSTTQRKYTGSKKNFLTIMTGFGSLRHSLAAG